MLSAPASIQALSLARSAAVGLGLPLGGIRPPLTVVYRLDPAPLPGVTRERTAVYAVDCEAKLIWRWLPGLWQLLPEQYTTRTFV